MNKISKRFAKLKPTKRNVDRWQRNFLKHIQKFFISGWNNLRSVRKEVVSWLSLICVLIVICLIQMIYLSRAIQTTAPIDGGIYSEGVVDRIATINPLYVTTNSEIAASSLVYRGLFSYDETGNLRGALAQSWSVSDDGKTYNVKLRENQRWSDGEKFTAEDVVFTFDLIRNPVVASPMREAWENIEVEKIDELEVAFTLENSYSSFPFMLTSGILPEHILKEHSPETVRAFMSDNMSSVVGTGDFRFVSSQALANGQSVWNFNSVNDRLTRIGTLSIRTYESGADLIDGFNSREINAAFGLNLNEILESQALNNFKLNQIETNNGVFVIFNNSGEITSDRNVREALRFAIDRESLRNSLAIEADMNGQKIEILAPKPLETPISPGIFDSVDRLRQPSFDIEKADEKLNEAGWELDDEGRRVKDDEVMELNVVTVKNTDYERAAEIITEMLEEIGVKINLISADPSTFQQEYLMSRNYDILIYQLHLGSDPDVSAYWTSAAISETGLNFANYRNRVSDLFLTNARLEVNKVRRTARYTDFARQWIEDVPAIALYRPHLNYLTRSEIRSLDQNYRLTSPAFRFHGVSQWTVSTGIVNKTP